jgi:hypothetical protein
MLRDHLRPVAQTQVALRPVAHCGFEGFPA